MEFKNIFKLLSSNIAAQLIGILFIPIITRIFSPQDFGEYTLFISVLSFFGVIACLRYDIAISILRRNSEKLHLLVGSFFILVSMVAISYIVVLLFRTFFLSEIAKLGLERSINYIPLGLFFLGFYNLLNYYSLCRKEYSSVAITRVTQVSVTSATQILLSSFGMISLVLGYVLGQFASTITLLRRVKQDLIGSNISRRKIIYLLIKYKRFPKYSIWSAMLNNLGQSSSLILFSYFFGSYVAGLYALSYRLLIVPLSSVSSAVANYFFSIASEKIKEKKIDQVIYQILYVLSKLSFPFFLLLLLLDNDIYVLVFGDNWNDIGTFVRVLTPWLLCVFLISPISIFLEVLGRQKEFLFFQIILFLSRTLSVAYGLFDQDIIFTLYLFSFSSVLCWILLLIRMLKYTELGVIFTFMAIVKNLLKSFAPVIPLLILKLFEVQEYWILLYCLTCILLCYYYFTFFKQIRIYFNAR
ncbi:lipopolysaccharide biosynthesis protein [Lonepinella sp. BR2271]|uniref:lipopolysaccharide biosynthesis protein n=1 Tax=Lonepinella sp. BR2271 TaxID=3434550 RepID=UPI003F6DD77F